MSSKLDLTTLQVETFQTSTEPGGGAGLFSYTYDFDHTCDTGGGTQSEENTECCSNAEGCSANCFQVSQFTPIPCCG
jgi:hypothetical protein